MGKFCGPLKVGAASGGGTVGSQTVSGHRVVSSFEVPVAIQYELSVGDTHFEKIRCCEQAMAPFVSQNHGNEVCIYTFKQLPKTTVMFGIVSKDGPSYRMSAGRFYTTLVVQALFLPLVLAVPLLFIPFFGWLLIPVLLYFAAKNGIEFWSSWQQMQRDGSTPHG